MAYSASDPPAAGQWAVQGIFISENVSEIFDLNVLNPGEQLTIGIDPGAAVDVGETLKITLATSDGVTSQCYLTRQALPPP